MADKIKGYLEVGLNEQNEIVINHTDLQPDENGVGRIVFSVDQAMNLARLLASKADEAARNIRQKEDESRRKAAEAIPVDRSDRTLTDGSPVTPDHRELKENGQQKAYVVLSDAERAKGFVRPVRQTYTHLSCNTTTRMGRSLAETYARDPKFYSGTFCVNCGRHFPLTVNGEPQFVWTNDGTAVGSWWGERKQRRIEMSDMPEEREQIKNLQEFYCEDRFLLKRIDWLLGMLARKSNEADELRKKLEAASEREAGLLDVLQEIKQWSDEKWSSDGDRPASMPSVLYEVRKALHPPDLHVGMVIPESDEEARRRIADMIRHALIADSPDPRDAKIAELEAKLAQAEASILRTADGVPIRPEMKIWVVGLTYPGGGFSTFRCSRDAGAMNLSICLSGYSTEEAAQAAADAINNPKKGV